MRAGGWAGGVLAVLLARSVDLTGPLTPPPQRPHMTFLGMSDTLADVDRMVSGPCSITPHA